MSESRGALARGAELFASGRFFEAHEVWEQCWRALDARDERRALVQGLVQAAVACHHAREGNMRGARSVARKALAALEHAPAEPLGFELEPLRTRLRGLVLD